MLQDLGSNNICDREDFKYSEDKFTKFGSNNLKDYQRIHRLRILRLKGKYLTHDSLRESSFFLLRLFIMICDFLKNKSLINKIFRFI